jgi:adenine-specific DNA-methyltransferase
MCQAFFPRRSGTTSAPFEAGPQRQIAVKVIDERGNELLMVRTL